MNRIIIKDTKNQGFRAKELFRMLRTNVEFTGADNRSIVLTSCTPGDGKSTISFQLAQVFAEAEKNVIYVDADMRKSVLRNNVTFKEGGIGLSHVLAKKGELKDAIYVSNIPHLHIIPTGIFPSNPAELLGKATFEQVLDELKKVYDYVIIDAPPVGSVIDAAVIASRVDGSILVVCSDKNSRNEEKRAVEQMRKANPNILGVVLNKVDIGFGSQYGKKYSSYYYYEDSDQRRKKQPGKSGSHSSSSGKVGHGHHHHHEPAEEKVV